MRDESLNIVLIIFGLIVLGNFIIVVPYRILLEKNKEKAKKFIHISLPIIELIILIVIAWYFINKKW